MSTKHYTPRPVFDTLAEVTDQYKSYFTNPNPRFYLQQWLLECFNGTEIILPDTAVQDYQGILNFLYSYRGSPDTFNSYRRELERLLQWSWFVRQQSLLGHKREDIEAFVEFCMKPPKRWIGLKTVARFRWVDGKKVANSAWRPFTVQVNKIDRRNGIQPQKKVYQFSQQSLKTLFGILGSFYKFLLQEEIAQINPVALIRQKSKFIRKEATQPTIRRLSDNQWQSVIQLAKEQAAKDVKHERAVFILSCLFSMYLRISELVASPRWSPTQSDFFQDVDGNWWFRTVGKGNKARQIAVSDAMLEALQHYRKTYLKLPPLPLPGEKFPLVAHVKNDHAPITSVRPIRRLVQQCFDQAADKIESEGDKHEAELLRVATVHWLRHTGISEDVKHRPREHVRDDAGHSSSAITDRYIDVELRERARSAKQKRIVTLPC